MDKKIRVAILDDHPSIVDGYLYRLGKDPEIEIAATMRFGEELEPTLAKTPVDVLLLDISVPTSETNSNPYPVLHAIPNLLEVHPNLNILIVSMHADRGLIRAVMDAGVNGYVLKDDPTTIADLGSVVRAVAAGGIHFSAAAHDLYIKHLASENGNSLSPRQLEALSLCLAYPEATTAQLAQKMKIKHSTMRNLLSGAYLKLGARSRADAVAKARKMGLITPDQE